MKKRRFGFIPMMALIVAPIFTSLGLTAPAASAQTNVTAHAATKCPTLSWSYKQPKTIAAGWVLVNKAMMLDVPSNRYSMGWKTLPGWTVSYSGIVLHYNGGALAHIDTNEPGGYSNYTAEANESGWQSASITACPVSVPTKASPLKLTASASIATANQQVTFTATVTPAVAGRVVYLQVLSPIASKWSSYLRATTTKAGQAGQAVFKETFGASHTVFQVRAVVNKSGKYPRAVSNVLVITFK